MNTTYELMTLLLNNVIAVHQKQAISNIIKVNEKISQSCLFDLLSLNILNSVESIAEKTNATVAETSPKSDRTAPSQSEATDFACSASNSKTVKPMRPIFNNKAVTNAEINISNVL